MKIVKFTNKFFSVLFCEFYYNTIDYILNIWRVFNVV